MKKLSFARLRTLCTRWKTRADGEGEQAFLRVVFLTLALIDVMAIRMEPSILLGLSLFLALAVVLFVASCVWLASNALRRLIGMAADIGVTTWAMYLGGSGVLFFGFYLFVIFGNGFRYGRGYLFVSQALSIASLMVVMVTSEWWKTHLEVGFALLFTLVMVPMYVSVLLQRIVARLRLLEQRNQTISGESGSGSKAALG